METTTSRDGTRIAYDVCGTGPAVIYITGAICFRKFWPVAHDAKAFGKEFTVYNYDRRGRGDSGDTGPYAIEREVEDVEAIIDAAGGSAYVYGHSSGAVLALEAALRLGSKVRKVVMYDPSYVHDEAEKLDYAHLGEEVATLLKDGENARALRRFLTGIGMPRSLVTFLPVFPGWRTMKALAPTLIYDMTLTRDLPPVERAAEVTVPTLILAGEKSPPGIHSVVEQLTAAIPIARCAILNGEDHMVKAKAVLPHLAGFLKQ